MSQACSDWKYIFPQKDQKGTYKKSSLQILQEIISTLIGKQVSIVNARLNTLRF